MTGCEKRFYEYSCACGRSWGKEMRGPDEPTRCDNCKKMCMPRVCSNNTDSHAMKFCHFECPGCGNEWESRYEHPMSCQACGVKVTCKFTRVGSEVQNRETSTSLRGVSSRLVHSSEETRRKHIQRLQEERRKARSNPQAEADPFNRVVIPGESSYNEGETAPSMNGGSRSPLEDRVPFQTSPTQVEATYNSFNTQQGEINTSQQINQWEASTSLNGNEWEQPLTHTSEWGTRQAPSKSDRGVHRTPLPYHVGAADPSLNPSEGYGDPSLNGFPSVTGDPSLHDALTEMQVQQAEELIADGKILEELDEYQQAVDKYSEAIAIAPRHVPEYYKYRSRAYMKLDMMDEAQDDLRKSLMDLTIEYRSAPREALRSGASGEGDIIAPNKTQRSTTSRGTPVFGIQTPQQNQAALDGAGGANSASTKINLVPHLLNALAKNKFEPIHLDRLLQEYLHDRSLESLVQEMLPSILDPKSIMNFDPGSGRCFVSKVGSFCPNDAICNGDCEMWHLCKKFVLGSCEGSCGVRIHNFFHKKNSRILDQNGLYGVDPKILRELFLSKHRPQSLRPRLCHYYLIGEECYSNESCTFIHICRNFLNGCTCSLSHNLFNNHNNGVLRYYNVNSDGQCSHEEVVDRLAMWDPAIVKPVDSSQNSNEVDDAPREARQNGFHSLSDPVPNGYHHISKPSEVQADTDDIHIEPSAIPPAQQSNPTATVGARRASKQASALARPTKLPTTQPLASAPARRTISPTAQPQASSTEARTPSVPASVQVRPSALPSAIRPANASTRPTVPKHVTFWSAPPVPSPGQSPTDAHLDTDVPLLASAPADTFTFKTSGHASVAASGWSAAVPPANGFAPQSAVPVRRSAPSPPSAAPVLPAPVPGWRSKTPPATSRPAPVSAHAAPFKAAAPTATPSWQPRPAVAVKQPKSRSSRSRVNTSGPEETWDTSWRDTWEPPIIVPPPVVPLLTSKGSSTPVETYASRAAGAKSAPSVLQSPTYAPPVRQSPTSTAAPARLPSPPGIAAPASSRQSTPPSNSAPPPARQPSPSSTAPPPFSVAPLPTSTAPPPPRQPSGPAADLWQYCLGNRVWMKLPRTKQVALEDAFCNVDQDEITIQFTKDLTCSVVLEDVSKSGCTTTASGVQVKRLGEDDTWLWYTGTGCNSVWQEMRGQCGVNVQHQLEEAFRRFLASGAEPQLRVMMAPHGQVRVDFRSWIVVEPGKGVFLDLRRRLARK